MKRLILKTMLLLLPAIVQAQSKNLVLNPDFENFIVCPVAHVQYNSSHLLIKDWYFPTAATPDYFNRCSKGEVSVPNNFAGVSEPQSGNGYVGAILSGTEDEYREYLMGHLSKALEKGKKYCVTFYVKLASFSKFAVDQVSWSFYEKDVKNEFQNAIGGTSNLNNQPGLFIDNTVEWKQMCHIYTAKGGEVSFIIGNYKNYENTNYVVTDKFMKNKRDKSYAYYYFDNVAVKAIDNCLDCPCVSHNLDAVFLDTTYTGGKNPYTGKIEKIVNDGRINIGINGGTPPYTIKWSNNTQGISLKNLPAGIYSFTVTDQYNCAVSRSVTFIEPKIPEDEFYSSLKNIEEGTSIVLENIFFEYNKTALLPASYPELDKVVQFMIENDIHKIEISGHTDSDGSDSYNKTLSEGRAKSVANYLVSKGVDQTRLQAIGYGKTKPIDTNSSDAGKAVNRRVEFKLIKK
jgi:outer membrane protein OmpA-like peptidoglycan-associated protein